MVIIRNPPPSLPIDPKFFCLHQNSKLIRIYKNHRQATDFNNNGPRNRFDHHTAGTLGNPQDDNLRSVYYAAPVITNMFNALSCCIAEIFGDPIKIKSIEPEIIIMGNVVTDPDCEIRIIDNIKGKNIGLVNIIRDLNLLDLRGNGAMRAGTVSAISFTSDRQCTQAWGRYFYDNEQLYSRIDGIIYSGAHNEEPSLMLYERAKDALFLREDLPLNHPALRTQIQEIAKGMMIAFRPDEWL